MSFFRNSRYILILLKPLLVVSLCCAMARAQEANFEKCWATTFDAEIVEIKIHGDLTFAFLNNGTLIALETNGDLLWSVDLGGRPGSNIVADESSVWVATYAIATEKDAGVRVELRAISANSGVVRSSIALPQASRNHLKLVQDRLLIASSTGVITSINRTDGNVIWRREIAATFTSNIAVLNANMAVAAADQLFVLDIATGTIVSLSKMDSTANVIEPVGSGNFVVGDSAGNVRLFAESNGKPIWRFRTGGSVRKLMAVNGGFLVGSADNFVYFLSISNGGVKWKRRLTGRVGDLTVFDQGNTVAVSVIEEPFISVFAIENGAVGARLDSSGGDASHIILDGADRGIVAGKASTMSGFAFSKCSRREMDGADR